MTDHAVIRQLEPKALWNAFADLNAVPRPSKNEAAVSQFVADRGRALNLETVTDALGNVLIRKPASPGYENHPTVVLQSHIDMVWQKNSDTDFDFTSQGIQMWLDGDWVKARGTTLGADNGIGVATMLATLASSTIQHPPLECLFTIDEETGMTGAKELSPQWLKGRVLLNLDTEQDHELTIGCAGGADVTARATYVPESAPTQHLFFQWKVRGLKGGHSGMEIHLGHANANKIMNRLLWTAASQFGARLCRLEGGSLRNAIPRESTAVVAIPESQAEAFAIWIMKESLTIRLENAITDPQLSITCEPTAACSHVLPMTTQQRLLAAVSGTVSGIQRMSPSIPGLVQTSNNLARVEVGDGNLAILCLARSSVDTERDALTDSLSALYAILDGKVEVSGQYPGWTPVPTSNIVQLMTETYRSMFQAEPHVAACHAGLECGIIGGKFPGMEMISFGPNILGAHSPDERVQVSSVQKFMSYFEEVLSRL
jgi:dipeptidase D